MAGMLKDNLCVLIFIFIPNSWIVSKERVHTRRGDFVLKGPPQNRLRRLHLSHGFNGETLCPIDEDFIVLKKVC
jgi:hypothetical protein